MDAGAYADGTCIQSKSIAGFGVSAGCGVPRPHVSPPGEIGAGEKEMRVFQSLVGADLDADGLLAPALALAGKRVVVKRPDYAEDLDGIKPSAVIATKKNRFDVYVKAAMQ